MSNNPYIFLATRTIYDIYHPRIDYCNRYTFNYLSPIKYKGFEIDHDTSLEYIGIVLEELNLIEIRELLCMCIANAMIIEHNNKIINTLDKLKLAIKVITEAIKISLVNKKKSKNSNLKNDYDDYLDFM